MSGEPDVEGEHTDDERVDGSDVCPCCLKEVFEADCLCPHCGAPVSGMAGFRPWERTLAEGFIYRAAVTCPRKFIVLLGIWLIFLPPVVSYSVVSYAYGSRLSLSMKLQGSFWVTCGVALIYQATRNYFRLKREAQALTLPEGP